MNPLLLGTATAFGLAASAGLNTTMPLLVVGVLARLGLLSLAAPYDALAGNVTLAGLAGLALIEIIGDKVPGLDSVVHAVQWPLAAAAGAVLFASQNSLVSWVSPELSILVGVVLAGTVHGARAVARPVVTALTAGLGNTAVSVAEDVAAFVLVLVSLALPIVGLLLAVLLIFLMLKAARSALGRGARLTRAVRTNPGRTSSAP